MSVAFEPPGRPRTGYSRWTDERKELASSLWLSGVSAGCIAQELQGVTRCAVLGMLHRLGVVRSQPAGLMLSGRRTMRAPGPEVSEERREQKRRYSRERRARERESRPPRPFRARAVIVRLPDPTEPKPEQAVSFAQLNALHCRWVLGEPKGLDTMFCGAFKAEGQSFCGYHCRKAFNYENRFRTAKPLW